MLFSLETTAAQKMISSSIKAWFISGSGWNTFIAKLVTFYSLRQMISEQETEFPRRRSWVSQSEKRITLVIILVIKKRLHTALVPRINVRENFLHLHLNFWSKLSQADCNTTLNSSVLLTFSYTDCFWPCFYP